MLRRIIYLLITLAFLIVMTVPILAFILAARGELMVGNVDGSNVRLFMVNTDEAEGIGIQRVRRTSTGKDCLRGSVRYVLWEGQGDDLGADYCSCIDESTGFLTAAQSCE